MQVQCDECGGQGTQIRRPCSRCQKNKIVSSRIKLSLHLPRGAPDGFEVVFDGDADESPDWEAGDVVVRVRARKTEGQGGWSRKEAGLIWRETLSVEEALLGFNRTIRHFDGHEVDLSRRGVTQPGYVQVLEHEGVSCSNRPIPLLPLFDDDDRLDLRCPRTVTPARVRSTSTTRSFSQRRSTRVCGLVGSSLLHRRLRELPLLTTVRLHST